MTTDVRQIDCEIGEVADKSFAIIVSKYHHSLTSKLLEGALEALSDAGIHQGNVCVAQVPGAWELAAAAARMINDFQALICLGVVIKGDTSHDQYINSAVSNTLCQLAVDSCKPIGFGLLTCDTMDQAIARCGGNVGNKGEEAAVAAIQMLQLFEQL